MNEHQHDFRRFDDNRALCAGCGEFTTAPEPEWVEKLLTAIAAMPHVCTHYYPVPTYPQWPTYPTWIVSSGTVSTPSLTVTAANA